MGVVHANPYVYIVHGVYNAADVPAWWSARDSGVLAHDDSHGNHVAFDTAWPGVCA